MNTVLDEIMGINLHEVGCGCKKCRHQSEYNLFNEIWDAKLYDELSSTQVNEAVRFNNSKAQSLGWLNHRHDIVEKVLKLNYTPDDWAFAQAVADWQARNGLSADGMLGEKTWAKMQAQLGLLVTSASWISELIESHRGTFGVSHQEERNAANFYRSSTGQLRVITPKNISTYIPSLRSARGHIQESLQLIRNTSLNSYPSGQDYYLVLALATRESGATVFRTGSEWVVSAGKDTHPNGVSGLDYLYNLAQYFREAGVSIYSIDIGELKPGRGKRKPARIQAKHLLFAHMLKSASDEKSFNKIYVKSALSSNGISANSDQLISQLSDNARRAFMSLFYSGHGFLTDTLRDLFRTQKMNGGVYSLDGILSIPSSSFQHKHRVILARATSLRAFVFENVK